MRGESTQGMDVSIFRQAVAFVITPDLHRSRLNFTSHDEPDFRAIADALEEAFGLPARVKLRLPDDTIDQITLHTIQRAGGRMLGMGEFSDRLLAASVGRLSPIQVRNAWLPLQRVKERDRRGHPAVMMFVVEGQRDRVDFWIRTAMRTMDVPAVQSTFASELQGRETTIQDYTGRLPISVALVLREQFGVAYLPEVVVAGLTTTEVDDA